MQETITIFNFVACSMKGIILKSEDHSKNQILGIMGTTRGNFKELLWYKSMPLSRGQEV